MENQTKVKKTPVKYIMQEFIEQNKGKHKDYHEGFAAYEITSNPKASKGLFAAMWQVVYGKNKQERSKETKAERDDLFYSTVRDLNKEQESFRVEAAKARTQALLADSEDKRKVFKEQEEKALDAMLNVNRKIRNYLESTNSNYKKIEITSENE